jgi:hypothetical protein
MCNDEKSLKAYIENYYGGTGGQSFWEMNDLAPELPYSSDHEVAKQIAIEAVKGVCKENQRPDLAEDLISNIDELLIEREVNFFSYTDGDRIVPCYTNGLFGVYLQIKERLDVVSEENRKVLEDWLDNVEENWITAWFVEESFIRWHVHAYSKEKA